MSLLSFSSLGILSGVFPGLRRNGKGPLQLLFDGGLAPRLAAALLCLKILAIDCALRAGAAGGVPTQSMTVNALSARLPGRVWNLWMPAATLGAFALMLMNEFSRSGALLLVPMVLAIGGSLCTFHGLRWLEGSRSAITLGVSA